LTQVIIAVQYISSALHNDSADGISSDSRTEISRQGLDIMKKTLEIAFVLGAFIAVPALARAIHTQPTQDPRQLSMQAAPDGAGSARPVAGTPRAAQLSGKSVGQDRHAARGPMRPSDGTYLSHNCAQQKSLCDLLAY
jgi:hypothetical protein